MGAGGKVEVSSSEDSRFRRSVAREKNQGKTGNNLITPWVKSSRDNKGIRIRFPAPPSFYPATRQIP